MLLFFFPGLAVDAVAPPSSLPWLLLCGRSRAFSRTVFFSSQQLLFAKGLGKAKGADVGLWGGGRISSEGGVNLWDLNGGFKMAAASCLLRLAVWRLQITPLLPMTSIEDSFFLGEWWGGICL